MKTAEFSIVLPHEKWHTWVMTGQGLCADKTIVTFNQASVWFVSWCLILIGHLVSFQETEAQQQRREAAWTFGWHHLKKKRSNIRFCYAGLKWENRNWTGTSCSVTSMTWHCVGTMWRVNWLLVNKKYLQMDIQLQVPAVSWHCLLSAGLHLTLYNQ